MMQELWEKPNVSSNLQERFPWTPTPAPRGSNSNSTTTAAPKTGLQIAQQHLRTIRVTSAFSGKPRNLLMANTKKAQAKKGKDADTVTVVRKKASAYKDLILTGFLSVGLAVAGVATPVVSAIDKFTYCLRKLAAPVVSMEEIEGVETETWEALAEMELVLPRGIFNWSFHGVGHLAQQIKDYGPMRDWWVFGLESKLGHLKQHVKNRNNPEASIYRRVMLEEAAKMLKASLIRHGIAYKYSGEKEDAVEDVYALGEVVLRGKPQCITLGGVDIRLIEKALEKEWSSDIRALKRALQSDASLPGARVPGLEPNEEADAPPPSSGNQPCPGQSVWDIGRAMPLDKKEEFQGRERNILAGVRPVAAAYRACDVRRMNLRASYADTKTVYANSGVAMDPLKQDPAHEGWEKIGVVQKIARVNLRDEAVPFLKVSWYRTVESPHPELRGLQRVKTRGLMRAEETAWVPAHRIDAQVCFSRDLTPGENADIRSTLDLVHCKRSANYIIPAHILNQA